MLSTLSKGKQNIKGIDMDNEVSTETINITLEVGGSPLTMGMSVPTEPVKLRAMLPIIRKMSNSFIEMGVEQVIAAGKEISCRAGCGACCRQLVPVSESEAFDLYELVEAMPEPRRSEIKDRFRTGVEMLEAEGYFERLSDAAKSGDAEYEAAITDYFRYQIACPFLENESCSIHESRPITCREYLVTSPAELCKSAEGTGVENIRHFFQVKESLISIAREGTSKEMPYVPMVKVLDWASENAGREPEKTGREWMQSFFGELSHLSGPPEKE